MLARVAKSIHIFLDEAGIDVALEDIIVLL